MSHLVYVTFFGETDGVTLSRLDNILSKQIRHAYGTTCDKHARHVNAEMLFF